MIWFDHVILGVQDLALAAKWLESEYGLASQTGGVHPGGTANRSVRFSDGSYLELLAAQDVTKPGGAWLSRVVANGNTLTGWAVGTESIEGVVRRTGQQAIVGSIDEGGQHFTWQTVSHPDPARGAVPFFIQYDSYDSSLSAEQLLKRRRVEHRPPESGIRWVEAGVEQEVLSSWLGDHSLEIRCVPDRSGLVAVGILIGDRQIELRSDDIR